MSVFYSDTLSVRQYFHLKDLRLWMMVSIITLFLSVAVVTQTLQKAGKEDPLKLCHCITPPPRLVLHLRVNYVYYITVNRSNSNTKLNNISIASIPLIC